MQVSLGCNARRWACPCGDRMAVRFIPPNSKSPSIIRCRRARAQVCRTAYGQSQVSSCTLRAHQCRDKSSARRSAESFTSRRPSSTRFFSTTPSIATSSSLSCASSASIAPSTSAQLHSGLSPARGCIFDQTVFLCPALDTGKRYN
eukprot:SAG31_NODE_366_length_16817_cov_17.317921_17_plen_146_part_00